jgi:hypothetical protein
MPDVPNPQKERIIDKEALPTSLSSKEIQFFWTKAMKGKGMFSARTTSKEYLERVRELLGDYQTAVGKTATGQPISQGLERTQMLMREKLNELGLIEREGGKENGSIVQRMTNLGSTMRLNLIIKTNTAIAHSYQQKLTSQDPLQKILRPYFELYRAEPRKQPRNWEQRWLECANFVGWKGVVKGTSRMIATTESPIWEELGNRYKDSIGVDTPPFAWNSGCRWRTVTAKEVRAAGWEVG